jgi:hypothetical protein
MVDDRVLTLRGRFLDRHSLHVVAPDGRVIGLVDVRCVVDEPSRQPHTGYHVQFDPERLTPELRWGLVAATVCDRVNSR